MRRRAPFLAVLVCALVAPGGASARPSSGIYPSWQLKIPALPPSPAPVSYLGAITFNSSQIPNARLTVSKALFDFKDVGLLTGATGGDWLTAATPVGAAFGPSGPSATIQYLSLAGDRRINKEIHVNVTFKTRAPAGQVAIVVGDVDVETVGVAAKTASGALVSGAALQGTVTSPPFNYCDVPAPKPANCFQSDLSTPAWRAHPAGGTVSGKGFPGTTFEDSGPAAWLSPSVPVKSVTLTIRPTPQAGIGHTTLLWVVGREVFKIRPIPRPVVPPGNGGKLPIVVPIRPPTRTDGRVTVVVSARHGTRNVRLCAAARSVSGGRTVDVKPRCRLLGAALRYCRRTGSISIRATATYVPTGGAAITRARNVTVTCRRAPTFTG